MATQTTKETSLGELNVSKATAASPLGGGLDFAEGKLVCECLGVEITPPKDGGSGKKSVRFQLKVVKPDHYAGKVFSKTNPAIDDAKGASFWRTTMEAFGYTAAQLAAKVGLKASTFVGKKCSLYYRPKKEGEKYDHREFITPADFKMAAYAEEGATAPVKEEAAEAAPAADDLFN